MTMPAEKRLAKGLWWDKNWGVVEGCSKVSEGCKNCFAEVYAHRFGKSLSYLKGLTDDNGHWTGKVNLRFDQLELPLRKKKPTVWFVGERSDLFHYDVPDRYIAEVFKTIGMCSGANDARKDHVFIVLTKRPERMKYFLETWPIFENLPNVWLGVTAENQEQADARIPVLLSIPAAKRFVSIEPLLGPVNLDSIECEPGYFENALSLEEWTGSEDSPEVKASMGGGVLLDWVICGGESGPGARPVHPDWVRGLRDQCRAFEVPFFFKQWGEWFPFGQSLSEEATKIVGARPWAASDAKGAFKVGKKASGRLLNGEEHLGWPE